VNIALGWPGPAGAVLDEHQDVQPGQRDSIHVKEVDGQDPGGLRVQELAPGRAVRARRGVDARGAQDLVDGRWRDGQSQLGQLAVNTPVTPERVLLRQADGEPAILRAVAGRPGLRRRVLCRSETRSRR
jgi:hypothetical protein